MTIGKKTPAGQPVRPGRRPRLRLGALIGSGDRIGAFVTPFVLAGVAHNIVSAMIEMAGYPDQAAAVLAYMTRQSLLRAWGEFQQEHPLIVAPISAGLPFEAGKGYTAADVAEILRGRPVTVAVCALGLPAVALPVGIGDGLPQAVQVIGPRYREDLCLDAAAALEERAGIITPIDPRPSGADR